MVEYAYPTAVELTEISQISTPRLTEGRLGFELMPIVNVESHLLEWEQEDDWVGLQQVRGLGGQPQRVKPVGLKRFQMQPGIYGEFTTLDEQELTTRRQTGTFGTPINVDDMVRKDQDRLLLRRRDRIEQIIWTLLTTGTFSVANGPTVMHTDVYPLQTYSAGVAWGTVATATPLADFRAVQLLSRGYGVNFGSQARAIMNRQTAIYLFGNQNSADLFGRRGPGGGTIEGREGVNRILLGEDLPQVEIYDATYKNDAGSVQLYVPNNKVVVVGQRPGLARVGEYRMTRNVNNPDFAPGEYMMVHESRRPPKVIEVHDGHNGGPVMLFPSAVVVMTV